MNTNSMAKEGAEMLPKLGFISSKYMDKILIELKNKKRVEASEILKLGMRPSVRQTREKFLEKNGIIEVEEYKDSKHRHRKRWILTKKGEEIIKKVFDLESQI